MKGSCKLTKSYGICPQLSWTTEGTNAIIAFSPFYCSIFFVNWEHLYKVLWRLLLVACILKAWWTCLFYTKPDEIVFILYNLFRKYFIFLKLRVAITALPSEMNWTARLWIELYHNCSLYPKCLPSWWDAGKPGTSRSDISAGLWMFAFIVNSGVVAFGHLAESDDQITCVALKHFCYDLVTQTAY